MANLTISSMKRGSVPIIMVFVGIALAATPAVSPADAVAVNLVGSLHVSDDCMDDVVLVVHIEGASRLVPVSKTGRFTMVLPGNTKATLRFDKPGHVRKDVVVDTHNAGTNWSGQDIRQVRFAVKLYPEWDLLSLRYTGPVGTIGFDPNSGSLTATQDLNMVPMKRKELREF